MPIYILQPEQGCVIFTRKFITPVLVLLALLAVCATAFSVTSRGGSTKAAFVANFSRHVVKHPLRLRGLSPNTRAIGSGLTPAQLRKAYGINRLANNGAGVTVAIIDAYGNPNAQADLNAYDNKFGLPAATITTIYPQGNVGSVDEGWALETDLDVQMVHAIAPKAKILLEAAKSPTDADLYGAVKDAYTNHGAKVVSMSFGGDESAGGTREDSVFATGNAKGVSFTASSGDSGTGVQYPAASPYVTSVGGTSLNVQSDGTYRSETAWNGSGGGLSAYENAPTYQAGFNKNTKRGIPDVAMVANPNTGVDVYDSFGYNGQKGFFILGGTSVAAPLFAGILALVDQGRTRTLKNANVQIYAVAKIAYTTDFHDITSGNNGSCGRICNAYKGYDYVTGLGSPVANKLVPAIISKY